MEPTTANAIAVIAGRFASGSWNDIDVDLLIELATAAGTFAPRLTAERIANADARRTRRRELQMKAEAR